MLRPSHARDLVEIWTVINDGAQAYRGVIPADRLADPYMSMDKLAHEIESGVDFLVCEEEEQAADKTITAVMGIQKVLDVSLIRHAYVRSNSQGKGLGTQLLQHLRQTTADPILVGTWADASWAIRFYQRHGFQLVDSHAKDRLLKRYWNIPTRQIETSVVLADARWLAAGQA